MSGSSIKFAKNTLQCVLRSLPIGSLFQIISFGSIFEKMFESSVDYTTEQVNFASQQIDLMSANMGGTEVLQPLMEALDASSMSNDRKLPRQVFLLTDGQVSNTREVVNAVRKSCNESGTRVFTFGIGSGASLDLIRGVAHAGRGSFALIRDGGEDMNGIVLRQLRHAIKPLLSNVRVSWGEISLLNQPSPALPPAIFHGVRFFASAFIDPSSSPSNVELIGTDPDGKEHKWSIHVDPQAVFRDSVNEDGIAQACSPIHALVAHAQIKDLEKECEMSDDEGVKAEKKAEAIRKSESWQVLSQWTAFVGVERRTSPSLEAPETRILPTNWVNVSNSSEFYKSFIPKF